jgi:tRNA nucleotidyltransferase (CCA-adding enzyme)
VRILRVARFAARFGFGVHPDTMALMKRMVADGEADYLVPERVWQEFAKGLAEPHPQRMFDILRETGVAQKLLPELKNAPSTFSGGLAVRFARLAWPLEENQAVALSERLKAPGEVRDLAVLAAANREALKRAADAAALLDILKRTDAFRRPERFAQLLEAASQAEASIDVARLKKALSAATAIDAGAIAAAAGSQAEIPKRIDEARLAAIAQAK